MGTAAVEVAETATDPPDYIANYRVAITYGGPFYALRIQAEAFASFKSGAREASRRPYLIHFFRRPGWDLSIVAWDITGALCRLFG